jgi:hypothetical protein
MEGACTASDSLTDYFRVFIDKNAHEILFILILVLGYLCADGGANLCRCIGKVSGCNDRNITFL